MANKDFETPKTSDIMHNLKGNGIVHHSNVACRRSSNYIFIVGFTPGPRLNIKTVLSTYGDFHVKDKTAVRTSYL